MNTPTILVTGATGNVGRPLVAGLLAGGARVRAMTRDPAAAGFPPGVAVAGGDYAASGIFAEAVRSLIRGPALQQVLERDPQGVAEKGHHHMRLDARFELME